MSRLRTLTIRGVALSMLLVLAQWPTPAEGGESGVEYGFDIAVGPDGWAYYLTIGSAWGF